MDSKIVQDFYIRPTEIYKYRYKRSYFVHERSSPDMSDIGTQNRFWEMRIAERGTESGASHSTCD